ncbi:MAG: hypothetical protein ACPHQR_01100 [Candidatus Poseidoniaceae archaeon]
MKELKDHGLIEQVNGDGDSGAYVLTDDAKTLAPIFHDLFNWVAARAH